MSKRYSVSLKKARQIYNKTGGRCAYCGRLLELYKTDAPRELSVRGFDIDHVIPLAHGGDYSLDNLVPACRNCNHVKGTKTVEEFLGGAS